MEKENQIQQVDLNTPEGQELVNNVRSNLRVRIEVNGDKEVDLKLSVDQSYVYGILVDFLLRKMSFPDDQPITAIKVSPPVFIKPRISDVKCLTPREIEIMDKLSEGKTLKEVSGETGMCLNTIKTHLKIIYRKLNVKKVASAVIEYLKLKGVIQHLDHDE